MSTDDLERVAAARETLEAVLLGSGGLAAAIPVAAEEALRNASLELGRLGHATPGDSRTLGWIDAARSELARARGLLAESHPDEASDLDEVDVLLGVLRPSFLDAVAARPVAPPPTRSRDSFRASVGVPQLFTGIDVPGPPPLVVDEAALRARDDDDDDEVASPLERAAVHPLGRYARDCLESLADLGSLRTLRDHEPWGDGLAFEARLLAALDALAAFALPRGEHDAPVDVMGEAFRYATEWAVPDIGRTFALTFFLGCVDAEEAHRGLQWSVLRAPPRTHVAVVDALCLAPSPAVDDVLEGLLGEQEPGLLRLAVDVARRRGTRVPERVLTLAGHPEVSVARAALGAAPDLSAALADSVAREITFRGGELALLAATVLVEVGAHGAIAALRTALEAAPPDHPDLARAVTTLAIQGESADGALLRRLATGRLDLLAALSLHGDPASAGIFIAELRARTGDLDATPRIAACLRRLLGPLPPADGAAGDVDPDRWAAHLATHGPIAGRVREGVPFAARTILDELRSASTRQGDRRLLARELRHHVRRGQILDVGAFDVDGWTVAQEAALARGRAARIA